MKAHQIQNGRTQKVSWNSLLAQSHDTPRLPPKILHNHCLQVLLGHEDYYFFFWGGGGEVKEVYYGICAGSE